MSDDGTVSSLEDSDIGRLSDLEDFKKLEERPNSEEKDGSDDISDDLGVSVSDSDDTTGDGKGLVISSEEDEDSNEVAEDVEEKKKEMAFAGDLKQIRQRIDHCVTILENWKAATEDKKMQKIIGGQSRKDLIKQLKLDCSSYFGWNDGACDYFSNMFAPRELVDWFESNEAPRPITAQVNTLKVKRKNLIASLIVRGVNSKPLPWTKHGITITEATVAPGATAEYLAGHYMLQSASSMVSASALAPIPGEVVVDVAASPGGKTIHLCQLMKNKGIVYANELKAERISPLQSNIYRMGIRNAVVINADGCKLPEFLGVNSVDRVLLDAPCSGSGIAAKDGQIKAERDANDFKEHGQLQRRLLKAAIDLTNCNSKTGGYIVYSTCSVAVEENEEVVEFALRNLPVKLIEFEPSSIGSPAFTSFRGKNFHPSMKNARRFFPHRDDMDGFFVAKFQKVADGSQDTKRARKS